MHYLPEALVDGRVIALQLQPSVRTVLTTFFILFRHSCGQHPANARVLRAVQARRRKALPDLRAVGKPGVRLDNDRDGSRRRASSITVYLGLLYIVLGSLSAHPLPTAILQPLLSPP